VISEKKENIKLPIESLKYHNAPVEIPNLLSPAPVENQSQPIGSDVIQATDANETHAGPVNFDGCSGYKIAHPTRTLYYPNLEKCLSLESDLQVDEKCALNL
jgi:hypothetical protein